MNPPSAIAEMGRESPVALRDPSTRSPEARASRRNRLPSVHLETGVEPRAPLDRCPRTDALNAGRSCFRHAAGLP
jgi:hypothetical protein